MAGGHFCIHKGYCLNCKGPHYQRKARWNEDDVPMAMVFNYHISFENASIGFACPRLKSQHPGGWLCSGNYFR
jgi:hypothetical protein